MSADLAQAGLWRKYPGRGCAFRVMIAYQDYPSGRAAMDTYQHLLARFGRDYDFRISIWRFDVLQGSPPMPGAVQDAIDADAIIVATHLAELPAGIRRWIESWVDHKRDHMAALIALLGTSSGNEISAPAFVFLESAAIRAGMDFIGRQIPQPGRAVLPPWEPGGQFGLEGWGLNE